MDLIGAGAAAAALIAVAALIRKVWPILVGIVHFSDALPVLLEIAEEFKPNGGASLRDQVDAIAATQQANGIHFSVANGRLEAIERRLDELDCDEDRQHGGS